MRSNQILSSSHAAQPVGIPDLECHVPISRAELLREMQMDALDGVLDHDDLQGTVLTVDSRAISRQLSTD